MRPFVSVVQASLRSILTFAAGGLILFGVIGAALGGVIANGEYSGVVWLGAYYGALLNWEFVIRLYSVAFLWTCAPLGAVLGCLSGVVVKSVGHRGWFVIPLLWCAGTALAMAALEHYYLLYRYDYPLSLDPRLGWRKQAVAILYTVPLPPGTWIQCGAVIGLVVGGVYVLMAYWLDPSDRRV